MQVSLAVEPGNKHHFRTDRGNDPTWRKLQGFWIGRILRGRWQRSQRGRAWGRAGGNRRRLLKRRLLIEATEVTRHRDRVSGKDSLTGWIDPRHAQRGAANSGYCRPERCQEQQSRLAC